MKKLVDFTVLSNTSPGASTFLLELGTPEPLPEIHAGQFVNVLVEDAGVLLRRPISVYDADPASGFLVLLVKRAGKGTEKLSHIKEGAKINILLPLGNGFELPENPESKVLLVAGGVGVAPMYYLSKKLNERGIRPCLLIGTKTASEIILRENFSRYADTYYTTEDGSFGEKGYPTQHSLLEERFDAIYCCGPTPMMKAVASYAESKNIKCSVSLENKMACGIGACLCCVQETKEGHKCVCTNGPVFSINDLKWQI